MSKKIVILNGSPRANGNTSALVKAFTEGAESAGHTVISFHLHSMNICPCLGCCGGGKNPDSPCVQKDGMEQIYPAYKEADLVVLASPLYYWSISGQLKTAFDRLFAVAESNPGRANPKKECVLLMAAANNRFADAPDWYEQVTTHLGWTDKGRVLCSGVMHVGDIAGHPKLEEARELGKGV